MKILILPSWYPDSFNPVNGIFFKQQAEALNKLGLDIFVLAIKQFGNPIKYFKQHIKSELIENNVLTIRNGTVKLPRISTFEPFFYKRVLLKTFKIFKDKYGLPDIVHAHSIFPGGYGAYLLKNSFNIPYIITEHASFIDKLLAKYPELMKKVALDSNKIIAVSEFLKNKMLNYIDFLDIKVLPNLVSMEKEIENINEDIPDNPFRLINISMMNGKKNIKGLDLLIKAVNIIINEKKITDIKLIIIGDGNNRKFYEKIVTKFNLNKHIEFKGKLNHFDAMKTLKSCHAAVISSRTETFGIAGIESLYLGKPVIATKCGGPEDYMNSEVGLLVENQNELELAKGIIKLKENITIYNPQKLMNYAKANFSETVIGNKLLKVYEEIT